MQSLMTAEKTSKRVLVVCPSYLKRNWKNEVLLHTGMKPSILGIDQPADVMITNFEKLEEHHKSFKEAEIVICDEAHYLKNPQAQRTKLFFEIMKEYRPRRFIGLTGTPIPNRVSEFYSLLKIVDLGYPAEKKLMADYSFTSFATKFCLQRLISVGKIRIKKYYGMKNLEELRPIVKARVFRRTVEEVLKDLPKLMVKNVMIDKVDDDLAKLLLQTYEASESGGHNPDQSVTTAKVHSAMFKVPFTIQYVKELLDQGARPLVLFTDHLKPLDELYRGLSDYKVCRISGMVAPDERALEFESFQAGKYDVLLTTIGSASTGINLTAANHVIFNDQNWIPGVMEQCIKRIHRIGQKNTCFVHNIHLGRFDELITKTIYSKLSTIKKALEGIN